MDYLYITAPLIFGGIVLLTFYATDEESEKECKHVVYPDDPVCLLCECDISKEKAHDHL